MKSECRLGFCIVLWDSDFCYDNIYYVTPSEIGSGSEFNYNFLKETYKVWHWLNNHWLTNREKTWDNGKPHPAHNCGCRARDWPGTLSTKLHSTGKGKQILAVSVGGHWLHPVDTDVLRTGMEGSPCILFSKSLLFSFVFILAFNALFLCYFSVSTFKMDTFLTETSIIFIFIIYLLC